MKHVFVIDPEAFSGQQWRMDGLLDVIGQHFRTQEKPDFTTVVSKFPRESLGVIQKQVDEAGGDTVRVYAIGGDAILFDCLNGIAGLPNMELAAMPYGHANTFIRSFGEGKAELFRNIAAITSAPTVPTDVIEVGNTCALSGCSVGFAAAVVIKLREMEGAKLARGLGRAVAGLRRFLANVSFMLDKAIMNRQYKIEIDSKDYSGAYSLVSIANAPYFGRRKAPIPESAPDDGYLDVVLFKSGALLSTLVSFRRYSKGRMPSNCVHVKAKKVEMQSDKPMWIQTDSEYLMDTSVTFEAVPEGARVVAVDGLKYRER
jgi:diacylglycerol kinase family enzyme